MISASIRSVVWIGERDEGTVGGRGMRGEEGEGGGEREIGRGREGVTENGFFFKKGISILDID